MVRAAVTEIKPEYVDTGLDQAGDGVGGITSGTECGDNFGTPVNFDSQAVLASWMEKKLL